MDFWDWWDFVIAPILAVLAAPVALTLFFALCILCYRALEWVWYTVVFI